ncbi:MAG: hypothetical protein KGL46_10100 [Hyphomicrobiales bacterium]|nr:hypothetical protein [Hyphomicrobiales bacterium]
MKTEKGGVLIEARRLSAAPQDFGWLRKLLLPAPRGAFYWIIPQNEDNRIAVRRRVQLRRAEICDLRARPLAECFIQDTSDRGARLKLAQGAALSRQFLLVEDNGAHVTLAELAWRQGRFAGVRRLRAMRRPA